MKLMNSWPEIYKEFADMPEMVAFREWCFKNGFENGGLLNSFHKTNIKMMFGLLQCYAETKGWCIEMMVNFDFHWTVIGYKSDGSLENRFFNEKTLNNCEQAMLWCAAQYFKLTKGE